MCVPVAQVVVQVSGTVADTLVVQVSGTAAGTLAHFS